MTAQQFFVFPFQLFHKPFRTFSPRSSRIFQRAAVQSFVRQNGAQRTALLGVAVQFQPSAFPPSQYEIRLVDFFQASDDAAHIPRNFFVFHYVRHKNLRFGRARPSLPTAMPFISATHIYRQKVRRERKRTHIAECDCDVFCRVGLFAELEFKLFYAVMRALCP